LKDLFNKYGTVEELEVKRAKRGEYKFAFVKYKEGEDGEEAIKKYSIG
jgi:hypothetical protein